jgi:hypothetical protein
MAQAFYVTVKSRGKTNPMDWFRIVNDKIHMDFQAKLVELGEMAANRMKEILLSSNYNLNKLADSMDSEFENITAGVEVRIGNISKFPLGKNNQVYWEAFNDGFQPGASGEYLPLGSFDGEVPDKNKSGGKWTVGNGSSTFLDNNQNKKPIEPLRFVDIASNELIGHIASAMKDIMADIERNS